MDALSGDAINPDSYGRDYTREGHRQTKRLVAQAFNSGAWRETRHQILASLRRKDQEHGTETRGIG
jgi:hypothetical protein